MARINFLNRREGRYYVQVKLPSSKGPGAATTVFRSALGTASFHTAHRRLALCLPWVFDVKDNPELS
jgi:hypothetical protein